MRKISEIVIHHTAVSNHKQPDFEKQISSMARTHAQRLNNPGSDGATIQYHYVVGMDGQSKATRKHSDLGRHASNLDVNTRSIGICMTGNFDEEASRPKQIAEVHRIIGELTKTYGTLKISFHNEYAKKTCPGKNISKSLFMLSPNPNMSEETKKAKILELMNLNSELHPEIKTQEIKNALAEVNRLFRVAGFDNK